MLLPTVDHKKLVENNVWKGQLLFSGVSELTASWSPLGCAWFSISNRWHEKQMIKIGRIKTCRLNRKINTLAPCNTILYFETWSALVQIMACCLMAPIHYLNQCWLIINVSFYWRTFWRKCSKYQNSSATYLRITHLRLQPHFPEMNKLQNVEFEPIICQNILVKCKS